MPQFYDKNAIAAQVVGGPLGSGPESNELGAPMPTEENPVVE